VLLGPTGQRVVLALCAAAMLGFGLYFITLQVVALRGRTQNRELSKNGQQA